MNPYEVLGVAEDADLNTIKKAHRKIVMKHHPDRGGDPEKIKKINAAWAILSDPEKKRIFDEDGIVVDDTEDAINQWVRQTFETLVENWIKQKTSGKRIPNFPEFIEGTIDSNVAKAEETADEIRDKREKLEKYRKFAKVNGGENVFAKVLEKLNAELDGRLYEINKVLYRMGLLDQEFKRYEFADMAEDEAMFFVTSFNIKFADGTSTGFSGGSTLYTNTGS